MNGRKWKDLGFLFGAFHEFNLLTRITRGRYQVNGSTAGLPSTRYGS